MLKGDKKRRGPFRGPLALGGCLLRLETIGAEDWSVAFRFERNLTRFSAVAASDVVHLARAVHSGFALGTTIWASSGFVGEPFFSVERLLRSRKSKLFATIAANKSFILIFQENTPPPWIVLQATFASLELPGTGLDLGSLLVDRRGFEPLTPCMPCKCSTAELSAHIY